MSKYTYEYVKNEFDKRGYDLVSNIYKNTTTKIQYICRKHKDKGIQDITFSKFNNENQGCYYCGREKTINARKIDLSNDLEYKKLCEEKDFKYVNIVRKDGKIYIEFICNKHRELGVQYMQKNNMKRDIKGCKYCAGKELPEWYVLKKMNEINPDVELLEPYVNLTTRLKCRCKKHNVFSNKTPKEILEGKGCIECGKEKLSEQHFLSLKEFQEKVNLVNKDVLVVDYRGWKEDATFECKLCGHLWDSSAASMAVNGTTCPNCCHFYKSEKEIEEILTKWGYSFIKQYKFDDCKDKNKLPFDFYLQDFNTCIEYDGLGHFEPIYGEGELIVTQKHDKIKTKYCENNKIKLIRISCFEDLENGIEYTLFDKMVKLCNIIEVK